MCTINTDKIYLTWRKEANTSRRIIGVLVKNNDKYTFSYLKDNVLLAQKEDSFTFYQPFNNIDIQYSENVIECFKRRLLNPQRSDYHDFLEYWGATNYKDDTFSLLGLTGAKLLTDNFEFIAPHNELPANFYTDISWLNTTSDYVVSQIKQLPYNAIEKKLSLKQDNQNVYDKKVVKVLFEDETLGYIKSIYCENIFDAITNNKIVDLKIANIIKNGTIKEILLKISIS